MLDHLHFHISTIREELVHEILIRRNKQTFELKKIF